MRRCEGAACTAHGVHIGVSSALVGPLAWKGLGSGGGQGPCQGPGGRWATRVEGAVYVQV